MSRHEASATLRQMRTYAHEAMEMAGSATRADLDRDTVLTRALVHTLEMIGEAARRVSAEVQAKCREIPWGELIALRNRLIHGYDRVDLDAVLEIALHDLPPLAAELDRVIAAL